jgi:transglutaminase/protease-like cytokinesis protein 3
MKPVLLIFSLLLMFHPTSAQISFASVEANSSRAKSTTVELLHADLVKGLNSDTEKLKAFYHWITHNISYDVQAWRTQSADWKKQEVPVVLRNRKAVCHGYSNLFKQLCDLSNIPCFIVSGYVKENNNFIDEGHSWNAVFVDGKWQLIDATWGAGSVENRSKFIRKFDASYFFTDPVLFLSNHYPFDPAFQLVNHPVYLSDYKKNTWKYQTAESKSLYHFNDTLSAWMQLDSVSRRVAAAERMIRMNPNDREVKLEYSYALTDAAFEASAKGQEIVSELYPASGKSQTTARRSSLPREVFIAKIDSALMHFQTADSIALTIRPTEPDHKQEITGFREKLKHNMDVLRKERTR